MIHWSDPEEAAKQCANNHQKFESFCWHSAPEDCFNWMIAHTHSRDSDLLTESNADAINEEMKPFYEADDPDVRPHNAGHWAVGWVAGWEIRVYRESNGGLVVTDAFRKWCELQEQLENYPVLDEEDFSRREFEATLANIEREGGSLLSGEEPEDWASRVYRVLPDDETQPVDGGGGHPSEDSIKEALFSLGWLDPDETYQLVEDGRVIESFLSRADAMDRWEHRYYRKLMDSDVKIVHQDEVVFPDAEFLLLMEHTR